jgi:tetratricopeptide (TPR) repeat protein
MPPTKQNPHPTQDEISTAIGFYQNGQLRDVIKYVNALTEHYPQVAMLYNLLGAAYAGMKDYDAAIDCFRSALEIDPKNAKSHNNIGGILKETGKFQDAIKCFEKALTIDPNLIDAHKNLGNTSLEIGNWVEAIAYLQKAIKIDPKNAEIHNNLGVAQKEIGDSDASIQSFRDAIALKPDFIDAFNNLGSVLKNTRQLKAAFEIFQKALEIDPKNAEIQNNLGNAFLATGEIDRAKICYQNALAEKPNQLKYLINLCNFYEKTNNINDLSDTLSLAESRIGSNDANILYYKAVLGFRKKDFESAKIHIENTKTDDLFKSLLLAFYELKGKTFDKLEMPDKAFDAFIDMNKEITKSIEFNQTDPEAYFIRAADSLKNIKNAAPLLPQSVHETSTYKNTPCFLIGFPRSGTTLLDTILRSHSRITVVEEGPMAANIRRALGGYVAIEELESFNTDRISQLRSIYFKELGKHINPDQMTGICIDKMPLNALNAPILNTIFPKSKFILAIRHPYDCILSCYMQNFRPNPAMSNMVDLDRIVELYCITMQTWQLSQERYHLDYHIIRYEDLVVDMAHNIGTLLDFLELEWEDNLKDYQKTALKRDRINTPSYRQVVQPIYKDAAYRWESYQDYFSKYDKQIQPWINKFGYD